MREGDKVKSNIGVADLPKGTIGTVWSVDGDYVYVKVPRIPIEVEYYSSELEVIKQATNNQYSKAVKAEAVRTIKAQEKIIKEAQELIAKMQTILDS